MKVFFRKAFFKVFKLLDIDLYGLYDKNLAVSSHVSKKSKLYSPYKIVESEVGNYSYISKNSHVNHTSIGKFCSIGPNLISGWGIHPLDTISTSPMFYSTKKQNGFSLVSKDLVEEKKRITIGNDVFIGMNVVILDGVKIGDGAVIGAGTVVSKDVPPYTIAVGSPIRFLRKRFSESTIEKLLDLRWWDWPEDRFDEISKDFFDVERFVSHHHE